MKSGVAEVQEASGRYQAPSEPGTTRQPRIRRELRPTVFLPVTVMLVPGEAPCCFTFHERRGC
jgi:hypothetical protein